MLSDIAFSDNIPLDLSGITAQIFYTVSSHSDDTTCVYVLEEKVLFLGDITRADFFDNGYMDKDRVQDLIQTIQSTDYYPMCRKTPCFSYGDIRHFHRIYVSN